MSTRSTQMIKKRSTPQKLHKRNSRKVETTRGVRGLSRIWPDPLPNPFNIYWVGFIFKPALSLSNPNRTNPVINGLGWIGFTGYS
jgi:hypothetical protein